MAGKVIAIYTAPESAAPMEPLREASLEEGRGIIGDRYYLQTGTFSDKTKRRPKEEVTLIESEQVDRLRSELKLEIGYGDPRRNVVTKGIGLNGLVGKTFRVGEAVLEGLKLCEPCSHLAGMIGEAVLHELVHRGGLRARIVRGGVVRVDDAIEQMHERGE